MRSIKEMLFHVMSRVFTMYVFGGGMLFFPVINSMKEGLMLRVTREATRSIRNLRNCDTCKCADKGVLSSRR